MIDMTTVNQIEHNVPSRVYYRYIYITASGFLSKDSHVGNATYAIKVFSKTKVQWTNISGQSGQTSTAGLYTFLANCGYSPTVGQSYSQIQLFADNMSEICVYYNSKYCPTASISARTNGLALFYAVPEGTSTNINTSVSITSPSDWQLYYEDKEIRFYSSRISYLNSTAGSYTRLDMITPYSVSSNMQDLEWLINENLLEVKSFVYNGESYNPQDVYITFITMPSSNTVRVDVYDGVNSITIDLTSSNWVEYFYADPAGPKEVAAIKDSNGKIIWGSQLEYPYRRLEYLKFDGTVFTRSAEYNANNRGYRLIYAQTGWADNGLCYPFGIWTNTAPQNILLARNERSNTNTGFEVCRVSNTSFGQHPPGSFLNTRMVAQMRWGTTTTVYYRLSRYIATSYIDNSSGSASGRTGTNTGNYFIGAINDGGGNQPSNANGLLVGNIYEVAVSGSNSFNYSYYYVPCQRKIDGAIGFKQPHSDAFYPLIVKSTGEEVKNNSAYMGPVVEEYWDGRTYQPD